MEKIIKHKLSSTEAALWWLGQAGYIIRTTDITVAIDPYLSNSAFTEPGFSRRFPPPIDPESLQADIYIITHDHLDHLDPETLEFYQSKSQTWFIAPRLAKKKLETLNIPKERIIQLEAGEKRSFKSLDVYGVFALPTGPDVLDTTGYLLRFANGRSIYHTSDTQFHPLVLASSPRKPDVMLVPINGKWGNTGPEDATIFAREVEPRFVMPNHYDLMELNMENPEVFRWFCQAYEFKGKCVINEIMKPFIWV